MKNPRDPGQITRAKRKDTMTFLSSQEPKPTLMKALGFPCRTGFMTLAGMCRVRQRELRRAMGALCPQPLVVRLARLGRDVKLGCHAIAPALASLQGRGEAVHGMRAPRSGGRRCKAD